MEVLSKAYWGHGKPITQGHTLTGWNPNHTSMAKAVLLVVLGVVLFMVGCGEQQTLIKEASYFPKNMTERKLSQLKWFNTPVSNKLADSTLTVEVAKGTDFFNSPEDTSRIATAPLLFEEVEGDFVAKALVQPDFSSQWNAVALMMHADSFNWIKLAFENSDATGPGIVTVVTRDRSDDANGVVLENENQIWLAIVRKDNLYALHWSKDGQDYAMARLSKMPEAATVKIGVEFQSPVGERATHHLHYFDIQKQTVRNLRNLNE